MPAIVESKMARCTLPAGWLNSMRLSTLADKEIVHVVYERKCQNALQMARHLEIAISG